MDTSIKLVIRPAFYETQYASTLMSIEHIVGKDIMNIRIRQERNGELITVCKLIETAFAGMQESDHQEHHLVYRLHQSDTFIPELSLVAETDKGKMVGYILLTKVKIISENGVTNSLAVAPLAVLPEYQNNGIGGMLLR